MITLIILAFSGSLQAQNDGPQPRNWSQVLNFSHDSTLFADADSALAFTLPAGSVATHVYWKTDSATTGVDSLQLRSSASQVVLSTWRPDVDGTAGYVQLRVPNHPAHTDESLYFVVYRNPDTTGQIRVLTTFQEIY